MENPILKAVLMHARQQPDKVAVCQDEQKVTYAQLANIIHVRAGEIKSSAFVLIKASNTIDFLVEYLAHQSLRVCTVPIDFGISETSQQNLLNCLDKGIPANCNEIVCTTGTTGMPKGAMHTAESIEAITLNTQHGVSMSADDVILLPLPLNHSVGMRVMRATLHIGATLVLQSGFAFPSVMIENVKRYQPTAFVCVPAALERLYLQLEDDFIPLFSGFRYIEVGAGSLTPDMKQRLAEQLPDTHIYNVWGSSETGGCLYQNIRQCPDKRTSLGLPVKGVEVKLHEGRLALRGAMNMIGYVGMPELTYQTLVDGWIITSDMARIDDEGFVYLLGRTDDMINTGGEKVSPVEVEQTAAAWPQFLEVACTGIPDDILGKAVAIFYVLREGEDVFNRRKFIRFMSERLEYYKVPTKFIQVEELPRNKMGKLLRNHLLTSNPL